MTNDLDRERARFAAWWELPNTPVKTPFSEAWQIWQAAIAAAQSDESERDMSGDGQGTTLHKVNSGIPAVAAHHSPAQCAQEQSKEIEHLRALCACAYQLAGQVDAPVQWLDALSDAANGEIGARFKDDPLELLPVDLPAQCAPAQPVATVNKTAAGWYQAVVFGVAVDSEYRDDRAMTKLVAEINAAAHPLPPPVPQQELFAWEATTPAYKKFITQTKYLKLSPLARNFYKPLRCANCVGDDS